jgi:molybdopterin synthase catalytic subunit
MIEITSNPIDPDVVINATRTGTAGCVATYVGLIRNNSHGKQVASVEYSDRDGKAVEGLKMIAASARDLWELENVSIVHRAALLKPGDINLVVCVAAAHRKEGFAACAYIIDRFKENLPTYKVETYAGGGTVSE